jgi:hypothetical protein
MTKDEECRTRSALKHKQWLAKGIDKIRNDRVKASQERRAELRQQSVTDLTQFRKSRSRGYY